MFIENTDSDEMSAGEGRITFGASKRSKQKRMDTLGIEPNTSRRLAWVLSERDNQLHHVPRHKWLCAVSVGLLPSAQLGAAIIVKAELDLLEPMASPY